MNGAGEITSSAPSIRSRSSHAKAMAAATLGFHTRASYRSEPSSSRSVPVRSIVRLPIPIEIIDHVAHPVGAFKRDVYGTPRPVILTATSQREWDHYERGVVLRAPVRELLTEFEFLLAESFQPSPSI